MGAHISDTCQASSLGWFFSAIVRFFCMYLLSVRLSLSREFHQKSAKEEQRTRCQALPQLLTRIHEHRPRIHHDRRFHLSSVLLTTRPSSAAARVPSSRSPLLLPSCCCISISPHQQLSPNQQLHHISGLVIPTNYSPSHRTGVFSLYPPPPPPPPRHARPSLRRSKSQAKTL